MGFFRTTETKYRKLAGLIDQVRILVCLAMAWFKPETLMTGLDKIKAMGAAGKAATAIAGEAGEADMLSPLEREKLERERRAAAQSEGLREYIPDATLGGGGPWDPEAAALEAAAAGVIPEVDFLNISVTPNQCRPVLASRHPSSTPPHFK